jgi:hypothetical protein
MHAGETDRIEDTPVELSNDARRFCCRRGLTGHDIADCNRSSGGVGSGGSGWKRRGERKGRHPNNTGECVMQNRLGKCTDQFRV